MFCGIAMGHWTFQNLLPETITIVKNTFQLVATLCENLVFIYLGLALFSFTAIYDVGLIAVALIAILIARVANIFPITWIVNRARKPEKRIPLNYQLFMWFAGLRGAMAFALSINLPDPIPASTESALFTTTLMIVFFTVILQGAFTTKVLEKLRVPIGYGQIQEDKTPLEEKNIWVSLDKWIQTKFIKIDENNPTRSSTHEHVEMHDLRQPNNKLDLEEISTESSPPPSTTPTTTTNLKMTGSISIPIGLAKRSSSSFTTPLTTPKVNSNKSQKSVLVTSIEELPTFTGNTMQEDETTPKNTPETYT